MELSGLGKETIFWQIAEWDTLHSIQSLRIARTDPGSLTNTQKERQSAKLAESKWRY